MRLEEISGDCLEVIESLLKARREKSAYRNTQSNECLQGWDSTPLWATCSLFKHPHSKKVLLFYMWIPVFPRLACPGESSSGQSTPDVTHQGWAEEKDHLPWPASNALTQPSTAQQTGGLLCCKGILLTHALLLVHQHSQGLLCRTVL